MSTRMSRHVFAVVAATLLNAAALHAPAQGIAFEPYSYHEGFETDSAPLLKRWATNGEQSINFAGLTEERAFEGKRSYKLDITIDNGTYHYFGVPMRVPCEGELTLSARIHVADGTNARVGFGTNKAYPPTRHTGCGSPNRYEMPTEGWALVEIDLVEAGRQGAEKVLRAHTANTGADDVGVYLDRWGLFIWGGEGKRAIVYIDDVRIEGRSPSIDDYDKEIERRWAARAQRLAGRITAWRAQLARSEKAWAAIKDVPVNFRDNVDRVRSSLDAAKRAIDAYEKRGYGSTSDVADIEAKLFVAEYGPETIRAISDGVRSGNPYLIYTPKAITDTHLTSEGFPVPARVGTEVTCCACPGEYESATIAVYALEELESLTVSVSALEGPSGSLAAECVDVYAVKCWYQAGVEIWPKKKVYAPELLVKDCALVKVDHEKGHNYLRSTREDGSHEYLCCSLPESGNLDGVRPVDADTLQPVKVPKDRLQQYWFAVHVPDDAAPGAYTGAVAIATAAGKRLLPFKVTVRPFELLPSRLIYSIYYRARIASDGKPTITSELRSEEQYRAEIRDMAAHGVLYPTNYQGWDERLLRRTLDIRREEGLPTDCFFNLGRNTGNTSDEKALAKLRADVRDWLALCASYGYEQVYFYGIDEARGDRLASQKATWGAVQEAGGKTFVACYHKTFEAMGALLDCAVLAGKPDPEEAAKWHSVGSQAFCYAYPQVGNEQPERYRRNFGLVLWKAGFDGAMDYAYQHGFTHVWNDFDHKTYRDHNFAYPTVNGVVGTIQWEGFREAVDDVRYVTTLEAAIERAPAAKKALANEAHAWLDARDPVSADLDEVREGMAKYIEALQP